MFAIVVHRDEMGLHHRGCCTARHEWGVDRNLVFLGIPVMKGIAARTASRRYFLNANQVAGPMNRKL